MSNIPTDEINIYFKAATEDLTIQLPLTLVTVIQLNHYVFLNNSLHSELLLPCFILDII